MKREGDFVLTVLARIDCFYAASRIIYTKERGMGQLLSINSHTLSYYDDAPEDVHEDTTFPDLYQLPPEIGLKIISHLDAQSVISIEQIWEDFGNDELIWKGLCYSSWRYCYGYHKKDKSPNFWRDLYNQLDRCTRLINGTVTKIPNCDSYLRSTIWRYLPSIISGGSHIHVHHLNPMEVAKFICGTDLLHSRGICRILELVPGVLQEYVKLHDFTALFLPIALRSFLFQLSISTSSHNPFIRLLITEFSSHYCYCNPTFSEGAVTIVCHSLIFLSNDRSNPSINNKMSKREFIKNTSQALIQEQQLCNELDKEFFGHLYDNIYLLGHIAPTRIE